MGGFSDTVLVLFLVVCIGGGVTRGPCSDAQKYAMIFYQLCCGQAGRQQCAPRVVFLASKHAGEEASARPYGVGDLVADRRQAVN